MLKVNTRIEQLNMQFNKFSPAMRLQIQKVWILSNRVAWKLVFKETELTERERAQLQTLTERAKLSRMAKIPETSV